LKLQDSFFERNGERILMGGNSTIKGISRFLLLYIFIHYSPAASLEKIIHPEYYADWLTA
jgi:hypothetical protein